MTTETKSAKPKSRALPVEPGEWTPEHDLVVFRRVQKLLAEVPPQAMGRMRGYLSHLVATTSWNHGPGDLPLLPQVESLR